MLAEGFLRVLLYREERKLASASISDLRAPLKMLTTATSPPQIHLKQVGNHVKCSKMFCLTPIAFNSDLYNFYCFLLFKN